MIWYTNEECPKCNANIHHAQTWEVERLPYTRRVVLEKSRLYVCAYCGWEGTNPNRKEDAQQPIADGKIRRRGRDGNDRSREGQLRAVATQHIL